MVEHFYLAILCLRHFTWEIYACDACYGSGDRTPTIARYHCSYKLLTIPDSILSVDRFS